MTHIYDPIEALLNDQSLPEPEWIDIDRIEPHPDNPRKDLGDLTELCDSIKAHGILQNLTVVPHPEKPGAFRCVIGHRRLAAAKLAGLPKVICICDNIMNYEDQVCTMMLENLQRSDLNAFEQARGFQMMIDFGLSVADISDKTGISRSTVRRRLKLSELDADRLQKKSSEVQISIREMELLAEVNDVHERQKILDKVGTGDFDYAIKNAIRKQKIDNNLPFIKKHLKKDYGATEIPVNKTWSLDYETLGKDINCIEYKSGDVDRALKGVTLPADGLFFCFKEYEGVIRLYKKAVKAKKSTPKKSEAELLREKAIADAYGEIDLINRIAYQRRREFFEAMKPKSSDLISLLRFALKLTYLHKNMSKLVVTKELNKICGIEGDKSESSSVYTEAFETVSVNDLPMLIFILSGDDEKAGFEGSSRFRAPEYCNNSFLRAEYEFLLSMGYQMSDAEQQMLDGTHEIFSRNFDQK